MTEFHSSLSQTVKKTALNIHVPTIIFPLSWGCRKSKPPTTSCTKATPGAAQRTLSSSSGFSDPVFLIWWGLGLFFSAFYIAITTQCMARDKAKYQFPPAPWPEGKGAVTSVQTLLHCLIWKDSAEGDEARTLHNMKRINKQTCNPFFLPCPGTITLLSHVFFKCECSS